MGRAKEIEVKVIPSQIANQFVARHHYSKKYVQNSVLHFGCFLDGKLHGVLQYGSPIDKRKCIGFVDTGLSINEGWRSFLELNRMAFDDYLPKNSESRCISISLRHIGAEAIQGFQLKYIYFLNPEARKRLTVPELHFSEIDKIGAGMYKGVRIERGRALEAL